jgi:cobalt-zinc-cadmium efflux system membrane fusion protein
VSTRALAFVLLSIVSATSGCESRAATSREAQPPNGEVWMTPAQVRDAHVQLEAVAKRSVGNEVVTSGKVTFADLRVSHVFSPVNGRVTSILAAPGQRVPKGSPLAVIESPDVGSTFADLAKAQADLATARHTYRRQKELYDVGATSQRELEAAQDDFRKATAELERSQRKATLFRKSGNDDVTQGFTLRAPIEGDVITRSVNPGVEVQGQYAGGTALELFTIGELDVVWVWGDVFEIDLGRVHEGADVTVKVVAYEGRTFRGRVDFISDALDPATRTAHVRCSIPNPDRLLKPEMYATVSIESEGRLAPVVPGAAVLHIGGQTVVFVDNGALPDGRLRFVRRVVAVDESDGAAYLPIIRGLSPGERVVNAGAVLLSGML